MSLLDYLLPYDFSPLTVLSYMLVMGFYGIGLLRMPDQDRPGSLRIFAFTLGVLICYAVMQTRFDYYAQYMFFVHRGQHLILHHIGPILIALSNPLPVMRFWFEKISPGWRRTLRPLGWVYRVLQQPFIALFLFVGLIYFWLWPSIHFDAMLSRDLYWVMNWSMLLDGLLFWWLIFDPRPPAITSSLGYGRRMLVLAAAGVLQMFLGAWIVFSRDMVYDVYEVCGRAWPLDPEVDQLLGGMLTYIPPAMMSILGILLMLRRAMHQDGKYTNQSKQLEETAS
ncbi:cytochrome c oxidase assembly protein [Marinobacter salarius]|jgi:putative membrane protein|uniref:cytochrome c oxidase assembly protein n=1 Tax=Marinobacter salarius TaxID=1420917 RepID=UPI001D18AA02|nr:cytochrome c oxidase assembly protein [Marinobacter salarius]MCC4285686.1 cytochrome c oxidase assembly protein [Marinobacter salarius]MDP4532738.1 cytochrome c oxidase assembly protein [Marinobacter salarius]